MTECIEIDLRKFDLWLLDNGEISQDEREIIIEAIEKFLKVEK